MLRVTWPRAGTFSCCDRSDGARLWRRELRIIRIVLTIAHLDHTPENCDPANLKALCQRCHLNHDKHHHRATRAATLRARRANGDLFA